MAKRTAAAKKIQEEEMVEQVENGDSMDPMENSDPIDPMDPMDQTDQSGDEALEATPLPVRDFAAEEAQLKEQLNKLKADKRAAQGKPPRVPKEKKEKPPAKPRAPRDEANGVVRPGTGVTKEVWDTADALSKRLGTFVDRATLSEVLIGKIETGTIHTQYGRWRKYYGLTETAEQRTARLEQIRQKKLADLAAAQQAEAQGEAT